MSATGTNPDTLLAACIDEVDRLLKLCDEMPSLSAYQHAKQGEPYDDEVWAYTRAGHKVWPVLESSGLNGHTNAAQIAAAVNQMRPAQEMMRAELTHMYAIREGFPDVDLDYIEEAAMLQSIARVLAANSPEIADALTRHEARQ